MVGGQTVDRPLIDSQIKVFQALIVYFTITKLLTATKCGKDVTFLQNSVILSKIILLNFVGSENQFTE